MIDDWLPATEKEYVGYYFHPFTNELTTIKLVDMVTQIDGKTGELITASGFYVVPFTPIHPIFDTVEHAHASLEYNI